jgi:adenylate cyclase
VEEFGLMAEEKRIDFTSLSKCVESIYVSTSSTQVAHNTRSNLQSLLGAQRVSVLFMEKDKKSLHGKYYDHIASVCTPVESGLLGLCARTNDRVLLAVGEVEDHPDFVRVVDLGTHDVGAGVAMVICPVRNARHKVVGLVQVVRNTGFTVEEVNSVEIMARHIGLFIESKAIFSHGDRILERLQTLLQTNTQEEAIQALLTESNKLLKSGRCTVFLAEHSSRKLISHSNFHTGGEGVNFQIPLNEASVAGYCASRGEIVNVPDAYVDPRFDRKVDKMTGYVTKQILVAPIIQGEGPEAVVGVLQVINKIGKESFDRRDELRIGLIAAVAGNVIRNINERKKTVTLAGNIKSLVRIAKHLTAETNLTSLCKMMMVDARLVLNSDKCTVFIVDEATRELWSKVSDEKDEIRFPMTAGIAGSCATSAAKVNIKDAYQDDRFNKNFDKKFGYKTTTILCMPILSRTGKVCGVVQAINKKLGVFTDQDEDFIQALAAQASVCIENSRNKEHLDEMKRFFKKQNSFANDNAAACIVFNGKGEICDVDESCETLFEMDTEAILKLRHHGALLLEHNEDLDLELTRVLLQPRPVTVKDTRFHSGVSGSRTLSMNVNLVPIMDTQGNLRRVFMLLSNIAVVRQKMTITEYGGDATEKTKQGSAHDLILNQKKNETVVMLVLDFNLQGTKLLNEPQLLHKIVTLIQTAHGVVHEITRDSNVVILFGIPFPTDDDGLDACSTALKVREVMQIFTAENGGEHSVTIGISSCLIDLYHGNHEQHKYNIAPDQLQVE